ncbi:MAG: hypothetical protein AAF468_20620 [Pseudomonadota bacterium]
MYDRYSSDRTNYDITECLVMIRDNEGLSRLTRDDLAAACNRIHEQSKDIGRLTELLKRIVPEVVKSRNALAEGIGLDLNIDRDQRKIDPEDESVVLEVDQMTDWLVDQAIATSDQTLAERNEKLRELANEIGLSTPLTERGGE